MNLQEFAALKPGDKIENPMSNSYGEVVEADTKGVRVRWGVECLAPGSLEMVAGTSRHYSAASTIWFHWIKAEVEHNSDCAVNKGPALPAGPCDCGAVEP